MGLFNLKIGNKNIDKSKTIRENINETILENITNSSYAVKTTGSVSQKLKIDCSPAYFAMLDAYSKNKEWGRPQSAIDFGKACSAIDTIFDANITLNVDSSNVQQFSSDLETTIKRDFQQMEESTKDKDWVEMSAFGKNINESENIKKIIDNVKKSNIRDIVVDTITSADITQTIEIGLGSSTNTQMRSKIVLTVNAISNAILKDVDKSFLDTEIAQLEKTTETDQISRGITGMFSDIMTTARTAIGAGASMFLIFILGVAFIAYFAPGLFCMVPGANTMMGDMCKKATLENRPSIRLPPPRSYPPQGYPPQGYPPQGYPPQGYHPQGYPPQGFQRQSMPPQGFQQNTPVRRQSA